MKFDLNLTLKLLSIITEKLNTPTLNRGGKLGTCSYTPADAAKLQALDNLIALLDVHSIKEASSLSFRILVKEHYQTKKAEIDSFISKAVLWYLLNRTEHDSMNPPTKSYRAIAKKFKQAIEILSENQQALQYALESLTQHLANLIAVISDITCKHSTKAYVPLMYSKTICDSFEELLKIMLTNPRAIQYFAVDLQGFKFMLRILQLLNPDDLKIPPFYDHNDIAQYFLRRHNSYESMDMRYQDMIS